MFNCLLPTGFPTGKQCFSISKLEIHPRFPLDFPLISLLGNPGMLAVPAPTGLSYWSTGNHRRPQDFPTGPQVIIGAHRTFLLDNGKESPASLRVPAGLS